MQTSLPHRVAVRDGRFLPPNSSPSSSLTYTVREARVGEGERGYRRRDALLVVLDRGSKERKVGRNNNTRWGNRGGTWNRVQTSTHPQTKWHVFSVGLQHHKQRTTTIGTHVAVWCAISVRLVGQHLGYSGLHLMGNRLFCTYTHDVLARPSDLPTPTFIRARGIKLRSTLRYWRCGSCGGHNQELKKRVRRQ